VVDSTAQDIALEMGNGIYGVGIFSILAIKLDLNYWGLEPLSWQLGGQITNRC
jgi:hypothetical protein